MRAADLFVAAVLAIAVAGGIAIGATDGSTRALVLIAAAGVVAVVVAAGIAAAATSGRRRSRDDRDERPSLGAH